MAFYDKGLRFSCRHCGACCKGKDAFVWLSHDDLRRLADYLDISDDEFRRVYTEVVDKAVVLKSFPNGDCIFYEESVGCRVHPARPLQCEAFPFWAEYVRNSSGWAMAAKRCPGVNSGELHSKEEIDEYIRRMKDFQ